MKKQYNIVVVGGGTAGMMAASYMKAFWGPLADIQVIYDHNTPGIGVGESLTPVFDAYLKVVGITTVELIKHCNATIKLGLKFKNWTHEGSEWYHSFPLNDAFGLLDQPLLFYNAIDAYDILHNQYDGSYNYGKYYFEHNTIPSANNLQYRHALHVDATLFSKYVEDKFKDQLTIIDGIVDNVNVANGNITSIHLKDGQEIVADIFIDATGYSRTLIKNLNPEWVDISDQLPTNRTIPNPLFKEFDSIPPYTTAEASKNGWILDVPLSNRRGTGYVYSSKFTTDQEAKEDFNQWLLKTHNVELASDRVISFSNGYFKNLWIGNCVAMGLASGFVEPLEATSIHHLITQVDNFVRIYHGKNLAFDIENYNRLAEAIYENSFKYIRFFYNTGRTDSEFWRYLDENKPGWLCSIEEKIKHSFITHRDIEDDRWMFESTSFNCIAYGHGMYKDNTRIEHFLRSQGLYARAAQVSADVRKIKKLVEAESVDHKQWIDLIKSSQ